MQLTPQQIRSCHRGLAEWPAGQAGDDLAGAVCRRLALSPDVRWGMVEEVRARLHQRGLPSPRLLADALVDEILLATAS